jgi:hypothetical protein
MSSKLLSIWIASTRTVLCQAHAIAGDNCPGVAIDARRRFDGGATQARARFDLRPLEVVHTGHEGVEAARVLVDEVDIDDAPGARGLGLIVHSEQCL